MIVLVTPSLSRRLLRSQQIYINSVSNQTCFAAVKGDRLGIYSQVHGMSVSYLFSTTSSQTLNYVAYTPTDIGDVIAFDSLAFPYDFSVLAWLFVGRSLSRLASKHHDS